MLRINVYAPYEHIIANVHNFTMFSLTRSILCLTLETLLIPPPPSPHLFCWSFQTGRGVGGGMGGFTEWRRTVILSFSVEAYD